MPAHGSDQGTEKILGEKQVKSKARRIKQPFASLAVAINNLDPSGSLLPPRPKLFTSSIGKHSFLGSQPTQPLFPPRQVPGGRPGAFLAPFWTAALPFKAAAAKHNRGVPHEGTAASARRGLGRSRLQTAAGTALPAPPRPNEKARKKRSGRARRRVASSQVDKLARLPAS